MCEWYNEVGRVVGGGGDGVGVALGSGEGEEEVSEVLV